MRSCIIILIFSALGLICPCNANMVFSQSDLNVINNNTRSLESKKIAITDTSSLIEYISPLDARISASQLNNDTLVVKLDIINRSKIPWYFPKGGTYGETRMLVAVGSDNNILFFPKEISYLGRPLTDSRAYEKIRPGKRIEKFYHIPLALLDNVKNTTKDVNYQIYLY